MAEWMRTMVVGMQKKESKEGVSVPDVDAKMQIKLLSNQKSTYHSRSDRICKVPPIDDEFAKTRCRQSR
jgi:hypothetical protein